MSVAVAKPIAGKPTRFGVAWVALNCWVVVCLLCSGASAAAQESEAVGWNSMAIDARVERLAGLPRAGGYVRAADGSLVCLLGSTFCRSEDEGQSWASHVVTEFAEAGVKPRSGNALVCTPAGTLVVLFHDANSRQWNWDKDKGRLVGEARLHTWSARSEDHGRTWRDFQLVQDGYSGAVRDAVVTRDGRIVTPLQLFLPDEVRHVTVPAVSIDDGRTWRTAAPLDIGGRGHHDGAYEATITELNDGRVWLLMRTSLDYFWQSYSADGGLTWSAPTPTTIDASNAPGFVKRLASGRQMLLWNRLYPMGSDQVRRIAGQYSERASSWQRQELSVAFSSDDGKSWTEPVVLAKGKSLAYPSFFEVRPGEVWVFAPRGPLHGKLSEADFVDGYAAPPAGSHKADQ